MDTFLRWFHPPVSSVRGEISKTDVVGAVKTATATTGLFTVATATVGVALDRLPIPSVWWVAAVFWSLRFGVALVIAMRRGPNPDLFAWVVGEKPFPLADSTDLVAAVGVTQRVKMVEEIYFTATVDEVAYLCRIRREGPGVNESITWDVGGQSKSVDLPTGSWDRIVRAIGALPGVVGQACLDAWGAYVRGSGVVMPPPLIPTCFADET